MSDPEKKESHGVKNTLGDLNNLLFAELERLDDETVKGDDLREEIDRAKAITGVATKIIENGNLVLEAQQFLYEHSPKETRKKALPRMLED